MILIMKILMKTNMKSLSKEQREGKAKNCSIVAMEKEATMSV